MFPFPILTHSLWAFRKDLAFGCQQWHAPSVCQASVGCPRRWHYYLRESTAEKSMKNIGFVQTDPEHAWLTLRQVHIFHIIRVYKVAVWHKTMTATYVKGNTTAEPFTIGQQTITIKSGTSRTDAMHGKTKSHCELWKCSKTKPEEKSPLRKLHLQYNATRFGINKKKFPSVYRLTSL